RYGVVRTLERPGSIQDLRCRGAARLGSAPRRSAGWRTRPPPRAGRRGRSGRAGTTAPRSSPPLHRPHGPRFTYRQIPRRALVRVVARAVVAAPRRLVSTAAPAKPAPPQYAPRRAKTAGMVLARIVTSSQSDQFSR